MDAQALPKAAVGKRFLATLIDGALVFVVNLIPILGAIVGLVYILTKDAIVFMITKNEDFKNRSVGKKLMGLRVQKTAGDDVVDIMTSIKRNFILVIGAILAVIIGPIVAIITTGLMATTDPYRAGAMVGVAGIVGILGVLLVALVGFLPVAIESILVLTNKSGLRLGDKFGGTHVLED